MKDYWNYSNEKPFSCDVEGCSMKFVNEDHLTVHKKRHEMTLNLALGPKGTIFTDQTPTPTQFIRNCEEVGLFQDLQNVNPFEETFKKAVEAVNSGQPLFMDKPLQSNPPDDTLHTPNIFPHISDVPNLNHSNSCLRSENIPCEDGLLKSDISENGKICLDITADSSIQPIALKQPKPECPLPPGSVNNPENQSLKENKVVLNVPKGHLFQLITPDSSQSPCNMVVIKNSVENVIPTLPLTVKEKLKKSLSDKKVGKSTLQKVPILKCPGKKTSNSFTNKFSKFSKNALKLLSKLENSSSDNSTLSAVHTTRKKKNEKFHLKESRSEFLARSRAASSRCREKKKMYVLYLEKVNSELLTANQNLQLINSVLQKKFFDLHNELLKHKSCSAADKNTEAALSMLTSFIGKKMHSESEKTSVEPPRPENPEVFSELPTSPVLHLTALEIPSESTAVTDLNSFSFDVAEVTLDNDAQDHEIPLNEGNKPPDIIVRFNSLGNNCPAQLPSDFIDPNRYIEGAGENSKQICCEHSYYFKKPLDVEKRILNYKTLSETIESVSQIAPRTCKADSRLNKNDAFRDITSLNPKVLLKQRTPPPLMLLKPFKKRSLQNKQLEKT